MQTQEFKVNHKPDCPCPVCNPARRLSDEKTVTYTVKMPQSLRDACREAGAEKVREVLREALEASQ